MSWFRRNPLDDILPGEPMPGVPERGSVEEAQLIDKVVAERPWRGLWYGFFYLIRQWCFTAYTLICATKFVLPFWSFVPLVAFSIWTDIRSRRTALDLGVSDRTYVRHVLRQETVLPGRMPEWRDYFYRRFVGAHGGFLLIVFIALALPFSFSAGGGGSEYAQEAKTALASVIVAVGPAACVLAAILFWRHLSPYPIRIVVGDTLIGALARKFWIVQLHRFPIWGYFGRTSKVVILLGWLFLFFLLVALPIRLLSLEPDYHLDSTFAETFAVFRWWIGFIYLSLFPLLLASFAACWRSKGAAIARSLRAHIFAASVERESQGVAKE